MKHEIEGRRRALHDITKMARGSMGGQIAAKMRAMHPPTGLDDPDHDGDAGAVGHHAGGIDGRGPATHGHPDHECGPDCPGEPDVDSPFAIKPKHKDADYLERLADQLRKG